MSGSEHDKPEEDELDLAAETVEDLDADDAEVKGGAVKPPATEGADCR